MKVKIASTCLHWAQPSVPHSPSSSQTLTSAFSSPSSKRRCIIIDRSAFFGAQYSKLYRFQSCKPSKLKTSLSVRRSSSACLDSFSDEEFSKQIQELSLRFQLSDDGDEQSSSTENAQREVTADCNITSVDSNIKFLENEKPFEPLEPPNWAERDEIVPVGIERKANSVAIPFSLRIIKKKKQWQDGIREAGESAYCSVKMAFSNMVFIIRELQSYTLQMREMLFYEDLQGILERVQNEMHASFVWLFQQVFSHTPTLMVYVMILLANYSVYSMASSTAIAATPPSQTYVSFSSVEETHINQKFDSSAIKTFSVSSSSSTGKSTAIGGSNGGGGKDKSIASGTNGDGRFDGCLSSSSYIVPDGVSSIGEEESVSGQGQVTMEEELRIWNSILEEASRMQSSIRDVALDHEALQRFVSPINAKIEADEYADYFRTELLYQTGLAQEPKNPLLLANYAQFLYLVAQDYDRAEEYFKKASEVEPKDAEALNKYANFLWQVRKNLSSAEETYLEAIATEPSNSFYASNYAHFLWSTGGDDTCFPL